jgi:hypothetical protein
MRIWVCDEKLCIKPLCRLELQEGAHKIVHTEMCPGGTTPSLTAIEREPFQDERGGLVVELRPGVRAAVLDDSGTQVLLPLVRNPLVGHVWRLMLDWSIYRNWYRGVGAFVVANPDARRFVDAYFREKDPVVAMGNLFSATERLLRAALKAEGVQGKILTATLPRLLTFCTSADCRYFNLPGMCCDMRSIFSINSIRIGIEHGDHRHDQRELGQAGWNPPDRDTAYQAIMLQRMLARHSQVCRIFDQVDPETGLFLRNWEPREFVHCQQPMHDQNGRLPEEEAQAEISLPGV